MIKAIRPYLSVDAFVSSKNKKKSEQEGQLSHRTPPGRPSIEELQKKYDKMNLWSKYRGKRK